MKEEVRIPRPQGVTLRAKQGDPIAHDILIEAYMRGLFPYGGSHLSMYELASQYNIPFNKIERKIADGIGADLLSADGNLVETLEAERLKLLSSSLYRIGASDAQIDQLLRYVASRVLHNPTAHPLLIKELNSTISNSLKLGETRLKTVQMLNDALATIIPTQDGDAQQVLTREEIMKELEGLKAQPAQLAQYIEDTPDLAPHNLGEKQRQMKKTGDHGYQKFPKTVKAEIPEELTVPPK